MIEQHYGRFLEAEAGAQLRLLGAAGEAKPSTFDAGLTVERVSTRRKECPRRDLNPCYRRERPVSWAGLDDGDPELAGRDTLDDGPEKMSRAGLEPATRCLKGSCSTA